MRIAFSLIILLVLLIILTDRFLSDQWSKSNKERTLFEKNFALFYFNFIPWTIIVGMLFFYFLQKISINYHYSIYNWFFFIGTLLYIPKFTSATYLITVKVANGNIYRRSDYHYPPINHKNFMSKMGIIMSTAPFVSLIFGAFKGRYDFRTQNINLDFDNLPKDFDGLKIVQISDLHLGSFGKNREPILKAIEMINAQKPDIILFTGDIVNNFAGEIDGWEEYFLKLKAPLGKYSILGNHDYGNYSEWQSYEAKLKNFQEIIKGNERIGFNLLMNENVVLEKGQSSIGLAGVENWSLVEKHPRRGDLYKATRGIENQPFNILMSHDPSHWDEKVLAHNFYDLTLSGHTHGMQFGIEKSHFRWSPAKYVEKRWAGLFDEDGKYLYVNRGLGYLGMPARIGMPPEITVIELHKKAA